MSERSFTMKQIFSISEMSKIVDIPINTLKHYDRIDLFKPAIVKPDSLYRYYTLEQIYTLVLIKDLRALDMSIPQIRDYLNNRNVNKSLNILQKKLDDINKEFDLLRKKKEYLQNKVNTVESNHNLRYELNEIVEKAFNERRVLTYGVCIKDNNSKYFASRQLEKTITGSIPGIIFCTHGAFIPKSELDAGDLLGSAIAFVFLNSQEIDDYASITRTIPPGRFICGYYEGKMWDRADCLKRLLNYIEEKGISVTGNALQINLIDDNLTDYTNEFLYEIQIPISTY